MADRGAHPSTELDSHRTTLDARRSLDRERGSAHVGEPSMEVRRTGATGRQWEEEVVHRDLGRG